MPTLARIYIMRVLFVENPVSQVIAASWVEKNEIRFIYCSSEFIYHLLPKLCHVILNELLLLFVIFGKLIEYL